MTTIPTIGAIARRLEVPSHRVEYVIRSRGIRPCGRAGNARVFSELDVERIAAELARIRLARAPRESELQDRGTEHQDRHGLSRPPWGEGD